MRGKAIVRTPLFVYRLRKQLRRRGFALLVLASAFVFAAVAGIVLLFEGQGVALQDAATPAAAGAGARNAEREPPSKVAVRMEAAVIEEMRQQPHADLSRLPAFELPPPLRSIDGTGFRSGEETIRLEGVVGPRAGEVCLDGAQRWSCGLQARAALHNLVAGRALTCQPRRPLPGGGTSADCQVEAKNALPGGDVARLLVRQGWARPAEGRETDFAMELEQARVAGTGLWRGGWQVFSP